VQRGINAVILHNLDAYLALAAEDLGLDPAPSSWRSWT
jgi:hypothetical protein